MYGDYEPVLDALRARGIDPAMLDAALAEADESGRHLRYILVDKGLVTEVELADAMGEAYGLPSVDLSTYPIDVAAADFYVTALCGTQPSTLRAGPPVSYTPLMVG